MVEYIFSDKTGATSIFICLLVRFFALPYHREFVSILNDVGTLTDNVMRFRRCSIGGIVYGESPNSSAKTPGNVGRRLPYGIKSEIDQEHLIVRYFLP
jgi:hypothetical protein